MGIFILGAVGLYLLASLGVVLAATRYARNNGKSTKRWGWGAALVMYLIPCWDWIPTVVTHQYYCATEAGFWVYKTPEQWMKENPGVMETLHEQLSVQQTSFGDLMTLDERFAIETRRQIPISGLSTRIFDKRLVDRVSGTVLAKSIEVGSGQGNISTGGGYKFWLAQEPCLTNGIADLTKTIQNLRGGK